MRATSQARPPRVLLRLVEVRPASMHVDVIGVSWHRTVSVLTDGARPEYPHPLHDSGESTGSEILDEAVRLYVRQKLFTRTPVRAGRWPC